ncbi:MAG: methyl-accepting chemotaxis protein [Rhodospirillaceae bacterium]
MKLTGLRAINLIMAALIVISGAIFIFSAYSIKNSASESATQWGQYNEVIVAKKQELNALVSAMGFGGMIHQFKNYVLRHDAPRVAKIQAKVADAKQAISKYRGLGISAAESQNLDAILGVVSLYEQNTALVQDLVAEGKTAQEIDGTVKINDNPALEGIAALVSEISAQEQSASQLITAELTSAESAANVILAVAALSSLVLLISFTWLLNNRVIKPISEMTQAMRKLANGDYSTTIAGADRDDEIGQMAETLVVFREGMEEAELLRARQQEEQDRQQERAQSVDQMINRFRTEVTDALDAMGESANSLRKNSEVLSESSEHTAQQAVDVASVAQQASSNVQGIAGAADELSSSVGNINTQLADSSRITEEARQKAETTNNSVGKLNDSVMRIGEVVDLINDIADQTNLLALNATIEAARAGDAGKGFAVVASEVKNLASQTGRATQDIITQIQEVQDNTKNAVDAIQEIVDVINQVSAISGSVVDALERQSLATSEITRHVDEIASGTTEVSHKIADVSVAAKNSGKSTTSVLESAELVGGNTDRLKERIDVFLYNVQAA